MKNIMKIMLALLTSVSLISNVSAGELTVTGSAKATYNIVTGGQDTQTGRGGRGKGIGITNEIDFGASGDLDIDGYSWNYQVQFDPGSQSTAGQGGIDDTRLELTTPYGTLGVYVSEGGLDTDNKNSQSVYGRPTDIGFSTSMADTYDIGSFTNLQYHLPSGILPLDATFKAAYATGQDGSMNSGNAGGESPTDQYGSAAEQYQVTITPIENLVIAADYYRETGAGLTATPVVQEAESGSLGATYTYGDASFGISRSLKAPLILGTSATRTVISNASAAGGNANGVRHWTTKKMSAAYNLSEDLSVSYEVEKSNRELIVNTAENDIKSQAVQVAYTMGGMTLALSRASHDNAAYGLNDDSDQTLFAMSMAF
jgi:hypothetical protein